MCTGIWVQASEGAKFWAAVCAQLANRGVQDVLIVCCDGLTGFLEAIEATWPGALVQTCVVHLIRASMRYVSYSDRKAVAAMLKPIYTAIDDNDALMALTAFADSVLGRKYPMAVKTWEDAWDRFIPFLDFGPATRKVIYTTNQIESLNYQMRKIIKNRGQFPNDASVVKLLWLAIRNIEDKRARERAKEAGLPKGTNRKAPGKLVEGATIQGWTKTLNELALRYPERFPQTTQKTDHLHQQLDKHGPTSRQRQASLPRSPHASIVDVAGPNSSNPALTSDNGTAASHPARRCLPANATIQAEAAHSELTCQPTNMASAFHQNAIAEPIIIVFPANTTGSIPALAGNNHNMA